MKKQKKKNNMILALVGFLGALLGVAAICMGFLPYVTEIGKVIGKEGELGSFTGFEGAFGAKGSTADGPAWLVFADGHESGGISTMSSKSGILILMIVILAGALFAILGSLFKSKLGKLMLAVGGLAMIAGGVMAFFAINLCGFESAGSATLGYEYTLGTGATLTGVFGIAGGLLSALSGTYQLIK